MKQVKSKVDTFFLVKGKSYWVAESDFMGHCFHVYVAPDTDAWIFNLFSEEEYNKTFCEMEESQ